MFLKSILLSNVVLARNAKEDVPPAPPLPKNTCVETVLDYFPPPSEACGTVKILFQKRKITRKNMIFDTVLVTFA